MEQGEASLVKPCSRCSQEPAYPGQWWGRACFRRYRQGERARKRQARDTSHPWRRFQIANPANPVTLLVGTARLHTVIGPVVVEALAPHDAEALHALVRQYPVWMQEVTGGRDGRLNLERP